MPSQTRSSSSISRSSSLTPLQKKQKMSLTQTYYLAHTARGKLSKEAARADHDLRLLVGHANLLDGLMLDLADAEQEQESWFNSTIAKAASTTPPPPTEPKHIQWSDNLPATSEEYDDDSDSSSEDESEDEISYATSAPLRRLRSPPAVIISEEAIEDDEDEDDEDLRLVRTPSRSSPPELLHEHDSESDSDDDATPPSPPEANIPLDAFSAKQKELAQGATDKSTISISREAFYEDGFYLPQRQELSAY
jgi:hypothetical protein